MCLFFFKKRPKPWWVPTQSNILKTGFVNIWIFLLIVVPSVILVIQTVVNKYKYPLNSYSWDIGKPLINLIYFSNNFYNYDVSCDKIEFQKEESSQFQLFSIAVGLESENINFDFSHIESLRIEISSLLKDYSYLVKNSIYIKNSGVESYTLFDSANLSTFHQQIVGTIFIMTFQKNPIDSLFTEIGVEYAVPSMLQNNKDLLFILNISKNTQEKKKWREVHSKVNNNHDIHSFVKHTKKLISSFVEDLNEKADICFNDKKSQAASYKCESGNCKLEVMDVERITEHLADHRRSVIPESAIPVFIVIISIGVGLLIVSIFFCPHILCGCFFYKYQKKYLEEINGIAQNHKKIERQEIFQRVGSYAEINLEENGNDKNKEQNGVQKECVYEEDADGEETRVSKEKMLNREIPPPFKYAEEDGEKNPVGFYGKKSSIPPPIVYVPYSESSSSNKNNRTPKHDETVPSLPDPIVLQLFDVEKIDS